MFNTVSRTYPACTHAACDNGTIHGRGTSSAACRCSTGYAGGGDWVSPTGALTTHGWRHANPNPDPKFGHCHGDCDAHSDCADGLLCVHNQYKQWAALGCTGPNPTNSNAFDVCIEAQTFPPCTEVACANGDVSADKSTCTCRPGFSGGGSWNPATAAYPTCDAVPCAHGYTSGAGTASASCTCFAGYTGGGAWTDSAYPQCALASCTNGYVSGAGTASASCSCLAGFAGGGAWQALTASYPTCMEVACPQGSTTGQGTRD